MCEQPQDRIEVTPAMIEAGVQVLYASGAVENPIYANDQSLVARIFLAMLSMSRTSHQEGP